MTRDEAIKLLHEKMKNQNLRRHCYAVEAVMRALATYLNPSASVELVETWAIAGLIHDVDYEETKEVAKKEHTKRALEWLEELDAHVDIMAAVAEHAWRFVEGAPEPKSKMAWALYTCDELTGLIVAVALVKPDKRLGSVSVESVLRKWKQQSFAAGVDRKQIELSKPHLGIELHDFIQIALVAMQNIHEDLGL